MGRGANWIAHIVKAVEHGHEVEVRAGILFCLCNLKAYAICDARLLRSGACRGNGPLVAGMI